MPCDPSLMCYHTDKVLPHNLLNFASLENIVIEMPCTFNIGIMNCFPRLTSLHLKGVTIRNGDSNNDSVKFDFSVLEEFNLKQRKWFAVKFVEIYTPSLTSVRSTTSVTSIINDLDNYFIMIVASNLENFMLPVHDPQNVILADSRVTRATLELSAVLSSKDEYIVSSQEDGSKVRKQLRELSHIHSLRLVAALEAIGLAKQGPPLPKFPELEKLDFYAPITVKGLLELLHSTPCLKSLFLHVQNYDNGEDYDAVESVPSCVVCQLEIVMLDYCCSNKPNLAEAKFLLKKFSSIAGFLCLWMSKFSNR